MPRNAFNTARAAWGVEAPAMPGATPEPEFGKLDWSRVAAATTPASASAQAPRVSYGNAIAKRMAEAQAPKPQGRLAQAANAFFAGFTPEGHATGLDDAKARRADEMERASGQAKATRAFLASAARLPQEQRAQYFAANAAAIKAQTGMDPTQGGAADYSDDALRQGMAELDGLMGVEPEYQFIEGEDGALFRTDKRSGTVETMREGRVTDEDDDDPYTLSPGARRYAPDGSIIAENPAARSAGGREVHSVGVRSDGRQIITYKDGSQEVSPYAVQELGRPFDIGGVPYEYRPRSGLVNEITSAEQAAQNAGTIEGGKVLGKVQADAIASAPTIVSTADRSIQRLRDFKRHPGFKSVYGFDSYLPTIRGQDRIDAQTLRDQIVANAFLEGIKDVKGLAPLTEAEGAKVQAAQTILGTPGISDAQAEAAVEDMIEVIEGRKIAAKRAAQAGPIGRARNNQPASGLTAEEQAELEELEAWEASSRP